MNSILIKKKILAGIFVVLFISTASADFYYNDQGLGSGDNYFSAPEFESQQDIATNLVAPFIFISILLHFALSRALNFILAGDIEEENYHAIPYGIPLRDRGHGDDKLHPDARKYAMIMSLTITASLVPTPYWDIIRGIMASIGTLTAVVLGLLFLYGFYNVAKALT